MVDQKRFSRMTMLAGAIEKEVARGVSLDNVLAKFDHFFRHNNQSFCALITTLQNNGFIEKKAPRTKRV